MFFLGTSESSFFCENDKQLCLGMYMNMKKCLNKTKS